MTTTGSSPSPESTVAPALRVAHVLAPAPFGGLERVVTTLATATVERGVSVTVLAVLEPGAPMPVTIAALAERGIEVVPLRPGGREYARERREALSLLRARHVALVHSHGFRPDVVIGAAARRAGFVSVSTVHGFTRDSWRTRLYEWIQCRALRGFDAVVAVSQALRAELEDRGVPAEKLSMIRNGVLARPAQLLSRVDARSRLGVPPGVPLVAWVGRMTTEKDPEHAVRSFAATRTPDAHLCLVGDGPLRAAVTALAESLGVGSRIHVVGSRSDAPSLFPAFDCLLLTSRTEGTPMVVLEAAVAEVPVVSTTVGGVPVLLGTDDPGLVALGDAAALGRAIDAVIGDAHASRARAARQRPHILGDAPEAWVDAYVTLYRRLVASRP